VIGHRGAAASAPENTLAGFRAAQTLGCRWVEFDVRLCADGALVLLHDSRIERTTDGSGAAARLPLAQIRQHDAGGWFGPNFAGERVPTLDETLQLLADLGVGANIEIKADRGRAHATAEAVVAVLRRRGLDAPLLVSSFLPAALGVLRDRLPPVPRGILFQSVPRGWRAIAARLGCATVNVDQQRLRPAGAAAIRAAGYPLLAYTVNDPARARELFGWGVTSVFSDAPDIILGVVGNGEHSAAPARQGAMR
jgi:glycerophosphoryl diester phosphodiesterase